MKYRLLTIDTTEGTTERGKEKEVPNGRNPVSYVAERLKNSGGVLGAVIFSDDSKPVTTVTWFQADKWVIYDHGSQDWNKATLAEMEAT